MTKERKVRVLDYDGMGGRSYEYYCGSCHTYLGDGAEGNFCDHCGKSVSATEQRDTWGYTALEGKQWKEH